MFLPYLAVTLSVLHQALAALTAGHNHSRGPKPTEAQAEVLGAALGLYSAVLLAGELCLRE